MKTICILILSGFMALPCFAKEKTSSYNLADSFRYARQECWREGYLRGQSNSNLIKCENAALSNLLSGKMPGYQQILFESFMNKRLQIAAQFDQHKITANQYQIKLAESAEELQRQLQGKSL